MYEVASEDLLENRQSAGNRLRAVREQDRARALGLAVSYLMTKPAFAKLPFGHWSRILAGQINRGHYLFVARGNEIVGFFGWALTTEDKAELWLAGTREPTAEECRDGDCILINAWEAIDDNVQKFVVEKFRQVILGKRLIYGKRFYDDGRVRPLRVSVNDFVDRHLSRGEKELAPEMAG